MGDQGGAWEPGGQVVRTGGLGHETRRRFDFAGRLASVHAHADGGETRIWRDGPGRAIPQNISGFTMRELIQRDVLGRPTKAYSFKAPTSGNDVNMVETFDIDSLGRSLLVQFRAFGLGNTLDVVSSFASGDAFRVGVSYADNIPGSPTPLAMPVRQRQCVPSKIVLPRSSWSDCTVVPYIRGRRYGVGAGPMGITLSFKTTLPGISSVRAD